MFGQASYSKLPYPKGGAPLAERRHDQMVSARYPPPVRGRLFIAHTHPAERMTTIAALLILHV